MPEFIARGRHPEARPLADPEPQEPAARMAATRPTTRATSTRCPYSWWTTGYAWNPDEDPGGPDELGCALGRGLRQPHVHARRHARVLRRRRVPARALTPNTTDLAELDQILAELETQKPLLKRLHDRPHRRHLDGVVDIAHCWSGDWVQMTYDKPRIRYVIPSRGLDQGQRRHGRPGRARRIRSRRTSGSTSTSTRRSAPTNTNYIGYMGPNEAALPLHQELHRQRSPDQPAGRAPGRRSSSSSTCQPDDIAKYPDRWTSLRAS